VARRSNHGCILVARRPREVRKAKGLSQADIGKRVGLAHTYISRVENARITPTLSLLERLAKGLEIDPYQLFVSGHEKKKSPKLLRLVSDGAQGRSLLQVFRKISCEDRSFLLHMARQMADPEDASKELAENHDEQARASESG